MRDHTCKKKLVEYTTASPSSKLVISSGILLLVETEEVYIMESNNIEDKVENVDCFVTLKQKTVAVKELLSTIN